MFDLLQGAGMNVISAVPTRDSALRGLRQARLLSVGRYLKDVHLDPVRRARVAFGFARNYGEARRMLSLHPGVRVLVWEDSFNTHVLRAAKDQGLRVIAIPQNLEALTPGFVEYRTRQALPWSFEYELSQLALADHVFTISREEQWLLRLRGIAADYLPLPGSWAAEEWLEVRRRRVGPFDGFVILRSATNPPTRAGIVRS